MIEKFSSSKKLECKNFNVSFDCLPHILLFSCLIFQDRPLVPLFLGNERFPVQGLDLEHTNSVKRKGFCLES